MKNIKENATMLKNKQSKKIVKREQKYKWHCQSYGIL